MIIDILTDRCITELKQFCNTCNELGYNNNNSLQSMKYQWCKNIGEYWGAWHNNQLISVAGAHPLPEVSNNAVRVLFRGCQIYSPHNRLSPHHMNSVPFADILPHQIEHYKDKDLYITTNITSDASGRMHKTHKVMSLLSKKGLVELAVPSMELYYTDQAVWKLNKEKYFEVRRRF